MLGCPVGNQLPYICTSRIASNTAAQHATTAIGARGNSVIDAQPSLAGGAGEENPIPEQSKYQPTLQIGLR